MRAHCCGALDYSRHSTEDPLCVLREVAVFNLLERDLVARQIEAVLPVANPKEHRNVVDRMIRESTPWQRQNAEARMKQLMAMYKKVHSNERAADG